MPTDRSRPDSLVAGGETSSHRLVIVLRTVVSGLMATLDGFLVAWAMPYTHHQIAVFAVATAVCWVALYGRPTPEITVSIGLGIAAVITFLAPLGLYVAAGWQWPASSWTNMRNLLGHVFWVLGFWLIAGAFATGSVLFRLYE